MNVPIVAAHDYDPYSGDKKEHPEQVKFALDNDDATAWSTERYSSGSLTKSGVGLYVDMGTPIAARRVDVRSHTPGFQAQVYGSNQAPFAQPDAASFIRWGQPLAQVTVDSKRRIGVDTGGSALRYYLVWITKLPPGLQNAEIASLRVLR